MNFLQGILSREDYNFVATTLEGSGGIYPGIFIPYYLEEVGGSDWNLEMSDEVLLNYDTGSGSIEGYSMSGERVSYNTANLKEEMLRKGRVIFSFINSSGDNVGGYEVEERKFWGTECHDVGNYISGGCPVIIHECTWYAFGIGWSHWTEDEPLC